MTKKVFRSILTVSFTMLMASAALVISLLYGYLESRFMQELEYESVYVTRGIEQQGKAYLEGLAVNSRRITWIDSDGKVLFDNVKDVNSLENHSDRVEIIEALESEEGKSIRYSETVKEKTLYYAIRLQDGTVLRISDEYTSVYTLIYRMVRSTLIILIVVFFLWILIARKVSRSIVKPMDTIDLEKPDTVNTYEELTPFLKHISTQKKTIQKQMSELKRQQKEFVAITENMSEGFIIVDKNTNVLTFNSSVLHLLDIHTEVHNQSVFTLNRSESFRTAIDSALNGKHCERKMMMKDRWYQLLANPVHVKKELVGAVLVIMDITEKEKREHLRREFSANVSHELKTPLTAISGIAEIMKDGIVKPEDVPRFAETIYAESQRLITLVGDIIKLSRLDENASPYQKERVNLLEITDKVVHALTAAADARHVKFSIEGSSTYIWGVSHILEEMVYNLCDNAIKYNIENGQVSVSITESKEEKTVNLTVRDTGKGIPLLEQDRIFERFYQVDRSYSKEMGGTGLGLSIVKHGALYHDAEIKVESEVEKGTAITILFSL